MTDAPRDRFCQGVRLFGDDELYAAAVGPDKKLQCNPQPTRLHGNQTYIERWAGKVLKSTTDTLRQNSDTVPTGYTAQMIDYTVPTGKTFYLHGWELHVEQSSNPRVNIMATLMVGTHKKARLALPDVGFQYKQFVPPLPVPAGTAVQIYLKVSAGNALAFVRFEGIEETT